MQSTISVEKSEIKRVLMLFPISTIRKIGYGKQLQFKSQQKEQIVDKLCEMNWNHNELSDLKALYVKIENEKQGKSTFFFEYESTLSFGSIKEEIEKNPFEMDETTQKITKEGFEITSEDIENGLLECIFWNYKEKTEIGPKLRVYTIERNVCIPFAIDTIKKQIHILSQTTQAAMSCRKQIQENLELEFEEPDIRDISSEETKSRFELLVNKIKDKLEEE